MVVLRLDEIGGEVVLSAPTHEAACDWAEALALAVAAGGRPLAPTSASSAGSSSSGGTGTSAMVAAGTRRGRAAKSKALSAADESPAFPYAPDAPSIHALLEEQRHHVRRKRIALNRSATDSRTDYEPEPAAAAAVVGPPLPVLKGYIRADWLARQCELHASAVAIQCLVRTRQVPGYRMDGQKKGAREAAMPRACALSYASIVRVWMCSSFAIRCTSLRCVAVWPAAYRRGASFKRCSRCGGRGEIDPPSASKVR
jgi:hypothetical protein